MRSWMRLVISGSQLHAEMPGDGEHVLVAASAEIHHDDLVTAHLRRAPDDLGEGMARLQRRDDALETGEKLERLERLMIEDRNIFDPATVLQPRMLRADARIVEAGRDRMTLLALPVFGMQQIGAVAMQHARAADGQ